MKTIKELKDEGFVREVISKIQQLRKQADFDVLDKIKVYIQADDEIKSALENDLDYLKTEVIAESVIFDEEVEEKYNINGLDTGIKVQRI